MFAVIFEVTEENEIITLMPKSGEIYKMKLNQEDADFYRRQLDEEIMVRTYFNKMPGEILGRYISTNPFLTDNNKLFRYVPSINSLQ